MTFRHDEMPAEALSRQPTRSAWHQWIYVLERDDGICKIGVSRNAEERITVLERSGGFRKKRVSCFGPLTNAYEVEALIHKELDGLREISEWFNCSFELASEVANAACEKYGICIEPAEKEADFEGLITQLYPLPTLMIDGSEVFASVDEAGKLWLETEESGPFRPELLHAFALAQKEGRLK